MIPLAISGNVMKLRIVKLCQSVTAAIAVQTSTTRVGNETGMFTGLSAVRGLQSPLSIAGFESLDASGNCGRARWPGAVPKYPRTQAPVIALTTWLKMFNRAGPNNCNAARAAIETRAAKRPYSIIVAPSSWRRSFRAIRENMETSA